MRKNLKIPSNLAMLLPTNAILLFLIIIPTILVIWLSLVNFQPTFGRAFYESEFIFLQNYRKILMDEGFLKSILRTILMSLTA